MDALKLTVERVAEQLQERMSRFEEAQKSAQTHSVAAPDLPADYLQFKCFVTDALSLLQQQVELLADNCDQMEIRTRRKMLLFHGVPETKDEDVVGTVLQIAKENLGLSETSRGVISRAQRMGRPSSKPRPLLVEYQSLEIRDKAWFAKTKLKGSGITASEFLTRRRHDVFVEARERHGISNCWTREGAIIILDANGKRHRVTTLVGLRRIPSPTSGSASSSVPAKLPQGSPKRQFTTPVAPAIASSSAKSSSGPAQLPVRRAKAAAKGSISSRN